VDAEELISILFKERVLVDIKNKHYKIMTSAGYYELRLEII
jgi:hypothetical protein